MNILSKIKAWREQRKVNSKDAGQSIPKKEEKLIHELYADDGDLGFC